MAPPIAAVGGHSVQDNIKIECIKYTLLCAGLFIWAPVLVWLSLDSGFRELWEYRAGPHMKERLFDALFIFFLVFGLLSMLGACAIVATYLRIKDLRVPSLHLIMVLSVADFFFALKYVLTGALVLGGHYNVQDDWWYSIEPKRPARRQNIFVSSAMYPKEGAAALNSDRSFLLARYIHPFLLFVPRTTSRP